MSVQIWLFLSFALLVAGVLSASLLLGFPCSFLDTKSVVTFFGVLAQHGQTTQSVSLDEYG